MPKTETAGHATERVKLQTTPRAITRFSHVKEYGDATAYPFSVDFTTGDVLSPPRPIVPTIQQIGGNTQVIEPEQGRSSIGTFTLLFLDAAGVMLKYLSSPPLTLNGNHTSGVATITVNQDPAGYPDLGTVELTTAGVVERVRYASKNNAAKQFLGCTRGVDDTTAAAHNSGDPVRNGEEIRPGQRVQILGGYAPNLASEYMSICLMEVAARRLLSDGVTIQVSVTDVQRSLRRKVFLLATAKVPVVLTGNPFTLALQILTSTGTATNGAYDVLPAENGLAIPQGLIDVAGIEALRDASYAGQVYSFSITGEAQGKEALEQEIWKTTNTYPFVTQEGKFSVRRYAGLTGTATVTLDESSIIGFEWSLGDGRIINVVAFEYDWNEPRARGQYGTRQSYAHLASIKKYGKRPTLPVQSQGIKTVNGGQAIADDRAREVTRRYAAPPPVLTLLVFFRHHVIDIGDKVAVTHSQIPNILTGLRGLTASLFEVLDASPDFVTGRVQLMLLWIGGLTDPGPPSSLGIRDIGDPAIDILGMDLPTGINLSGTAVMHLATFSGSGGFSSRIITDAMTPYTVKAGDRLEYDEWIVPSTPEFNFASVDLHATDGSVFRDSGAVDQNGISAHPNGDLTNVARGQWYHRVLSFPTAWVGKVLDYAIVWLGTALAAGNGQAFFANVVVSGSNALIAHPVIRYLDVGTFLVYLDNLVTASSTVRVTAGQVNVVDGIVTLSITRGGQATQSAGAVPSSTTEAVRATLPALGITTSLKDTIRLWWSVVLSGQNTSGGAVVWTWRIRRTGVTGPIIATLAVPIAGAKGGGGLVVTKKDEFMIDVPTVVGAQDYVITQVCDTAGVGDGSVDLFRMQALVRSS